MKELELTKGHKTIVCDCHIGEVNKYKWYYNSGYAKRMVKGKHYSLAWAIAGKPNRGCQVDHINRNKLDNRCKNLRTVSQHANLINRGIQSNNKSGYKGVSFNKRAGKWYAIITKYKKQVFLGSYETPEQASTVYNTVAEKLFGGIK